MHFISYVCLILTVVFLLLSSTSPSLWKVAFSYLLWLSLNNFWLLIRKKELLLTEFLNYQNLSNSRLSSTPLFSHSQTYKHPESYLWKALYSKSLLKFWGNEKKILHLSHPRTMYKSAVFDLKNPPVGFCFNLGWAKLYGPLISLRN